MGGASLHAEHEGRAGIAGALDFATVPDVWPELARMIGSQPQLEVSLADVASSNSAALALLLEALQHARASGCDLRFTGLPQGLADLAGLSNVLELLRPPA
jgi:phospholipid transport system transporter-binding protein